MMTDLIQHNLARAQQHIKHKEDKRRQERTFQVGDWVYVKLQPYIQQCVQRRSNNKLSFKYFGPYLILQCIGNVAYKLQLPTSSKIHPVLHVSQLKRALPPNTELESDQQLNHLSLNASTIGFQVIDTCLCKVGPSVIPHDLVKWNVWPRYWATWERAT
jgi:hypothetical protein